MMMKHKLVEQYWLLMTLFVVILILVCGIRADNDFHFNTTATSNAHQNSEHLKDRISNTIERNQLFINDTYILKNTTIQDTVIRLQNASMFLSSTIVIGTKILADGMMGYSVFIESSTFEDSEIVIDSASNVSIMDSHFIMEGVRKDEEPNHVVRIYNTEFVFISNTDFGNQTTQPNLNEANYLKIMNSTKLGIKMENVSTAELKSCMFTGIKSEMSNGSVMFLQNTGNTF